MIPYRLPPVGNRIVTGPRSRQPEIDILFAPWQARYYASGTQALSAALIGASRSRPGRNQVLLPAYACPDLLSAVLFAGLVPRLVELAPGKPWMDLDTLANALDETVCAVIGVNLFGIDERYGRIRDAIADSGVVVIEDAAQTLPAESQWQGDLVILSFGRGKPVSLLGGGAVLTRGAVALDLLPVPTPPGRRRRLDRTRVAAYNLLLHPRAYWLPAALPLGLGGTRFRPLKELGALPRFAQRNLPANLAERYAHRQQPVRAVYSQSLALLLAENLSDLPLQCGVPLENALLRYPILLPDRESRDACWRALEARGLGASRLYGTVLPEIKNAPEGLGSADLFPGAREFANRLLTLPLHDAVDAEIARKAVAVIADTLYGGASSQS